MRPRWAQGLIGALILVLAVLLAGCGDQSPPTASTPKPGPAKLGDIVIIPNNISGNAKPVRIGYFGNITHAQAVLGVSSGEFAKALAPAELQTTAFNAGPSLIEALLAGQIDIGFVGPGPVINAHAQTRGRGIRVIGAAAANGVSIVAGKGSGIEKLEELAGKRIASPQMGNTQDIAARHYVIHELKQPNANNVMAISNAEQAGLMSRGQVDAAWAPEPWASRLVIEQGARRIAEEHDLWPEKEVTVTVIVTTPEFLAARREAIEAVLRVSADWTRRLNEDRAAHLPALSEALVALSGKKLPPGVLETAIERVKFVDQPREETLRTITAWSHELGFLRQAVNVDGLIVPMKVAASQPASGK